MRIVSVFILASCLFATLYAASLSTWMNSNCEGTAFGAVILPTNQCVYGNFGAGTASSYYKVTCSGTTVTACTSTTSDCASCQSIPVPYAADNCTASMGLSVKLSCSDPATPAGAIVGRYFSDTQCKTASSFYAWTFMGDFSKACTKNTLTGTYMKSYTCTDQGTTVFTTSTVCTSADCSTGCVSSNATTTKCTPLSTTAGSILTGCPNNAAIKGISMFAIVFALIVALFL